MEIYFKYGGYIRYISYYTGIKVWTPSFFSGLPSSRHRTLIKIQ